MKRWLLVLASAILVAACGLIHDGYALDDKQTCINALSGFPKDPATVSAPPYPLSLNDVSLVYFESGCYGSCPSFKMTIRSSGVEFEGHAYVRARGHRKARINSNDFERLVRAWFDAKMYAMRDDYCHATCPDGRTWVVTDVQESSIELTTPQFKKQVYECYFTIDNKPEMPKPPQEYSDLKRQLFAFAKAKGWI